MNMPHTEIIPYSIGHTYSNRSAWAEIRLDHLAYNFRMLRSKVTPGTKCAVVIKSDAYGHGMIKVAETLLSEGADMLAVAVVSEGAQLRQAGIEAPILVLGGFSAQEAEAMVEFGLTAAISTPESMELLAHMAKRQRKQASVHIRIDMDRGSPGIPPEDCPAFIKRIMSNASLRAEGLFTHLPSAYGRDDAGLDRDLSRFRTLVDELKTMDICPPLVHALSSPGILKRPEACFDMIRPGILLYGLPVDADCRDLDLKPVMEWKAKTVAIRRVRAGTFVGYGSRWRTEQDMLLATVPVGYGDGLFLYYMQHGEVLVHGQRAPVFGQMHMDHFLIDVTHIAGVEVGDEVVLMGRQEEETIKAEEISERAGISMMNCDCVHLLSPRVPRVYIDRRRSGS